MTHDDDGRVAELMLARDAVLDAELAARIERLPGVTVTLEAVAPPVQGAVAGPVRHGARGENGRRGVAPCSAWVRVFRRTSFLSCAGLLAFALLLQQFARR